MLNAAKVHACTLSPAIYQIMHLQLRAGVAVDGSTRSSIGLGAHADILYAGPVVPFIICVMYVYMV
jgi:hypothetical protein